MLTHANLLAERDAAFAVVDVTDQDAILGVLPLFHSLAQLANLLLPFAVGARVVYLETLNSTDLVKALSERKITIFACVPQFFYLIHQRVMQQVAEVRPGDAASCSGRCSRSTSGCAASASTSGRVVLRQGPRRDGPRHAAARHRRLEVRSGDRPRPLLARLHDPPGLRPHRNQRRRDDQRARTMRTSTRSVARFRAWTIKIVDGEIAIRGPIVMQGYHNRPDATAEVIKDGWFYTGDLGRIDERGRITITGRKKEMIVLASGKNIYPEEIEAHYRKSPFVKEICVMGLAEPGGRRRSACSAWSCRTWICCARRRSSTPATSSASRWRGSPPACRRTSACSATTSGSSRCRERRRRRSSGMRWSGACASGSGRRRRCGGVDRSGRSRVDGRTASGGGARGDPRPAEAGRAAVSGRQPRARSRFRFDGARRAADRARAAHRREGAADRPRRRSSRCGSLSSAFGDRRGTTGSSHRSAKREGGIVGRAAARSAAGQRSGAERPAREAPDCRAVDARARARDSRPAVPRRD